MSAKTAKQVRPWLSIAMQLMVLTAVQVHPLVRHAGLLLSKGAVVYARKRHGGIYQFTSFVNDFPALASGIELCLARIAQYVGFV